MTCKIRILDEKTINQIAAGEVIENPASVIKELVDNALDAKASKIQIVATNSGRQTIRVQDDGSGMGHDDALLSIERHATSKIRTIDDLFCISSLGFRGEALSSIASVSEMKLLTAPNTKSDALVAGTSIQVHGGKILSHQRVECLGGTLIEVSSLFYNVPARRKFLKSPTKDASDIIKTVMQLALAHPEVAFDLVVNQEKVFSLPQQSLDARIKATLGSEFHSQLIPVQYQNDQITIEGYIAKPHYSRPTRTAQYLFINHRPVSSPFVSSVAKEAYGTSLDSTRHPAFVLSFQMAQNDLDVNVHPQKREVRFCLEDEIKRALMSAIGQALFSQKPSLAPVTQEFSFQPPQREFHQAIRPRPLEVVQPPLVTVKPSVQIQGFFKDYIFAEIDWQDRAIPVELQEEGIALVSAPLALSRIAYDGTQLQTFGVSQTLLVPLFIELTPPEALRLKEKAPQLHQAGIGLREFGPSSFLIEAIPSYLENLDVEETLRFLAQDDHEMTVAEAFAKIASVGKRRVVLTKEIAEQVVKKLLTCKNPFTCPFGAKIILQITLAEMEKKFHI